jgi:hypothetical protein
MPRATLDERPIASSVWPVIWASIATATGLAGFTWAMGDASYDIFGALIIAPILILFTLPLARRGSVLEEDRWVFRLIMLAFVLKMVGSCIRYFIAFDVYGGNADAGVYHDTAVIYAPLWRSGDFSLPQAPGGTQFLMGLTTLVYVIIGPTKLGGFLFFAWLGFWGQYSFYRAFRMAVPDGDYRRYAKLVFLMPTLVFWPSSIGKESWMILCLGIASYGVARILMHKRGGFLMTTIGAWGLLAVRPHIALMVFIGMAAAFPLRRSESVLRANPAVKLFGIALLIVGCSVVAAQVSKFFGLERLDSASVTEVLERTNNQTNIGGSQFSSARPGVIQDLPKALFTLLYRPLPTEADNAQQLAASLEGTFLLGLTIISVSRLLGVLKTGLRSPYVIYCLAFLGAFVFAYASFANFGLVVRQRTQAFPLVLALLSLPKPVRTVRRSPLRHAAPESVGAAPST